MEMTPELGLVIAQLLLRYGPGVAAGVAEIFQKPTHTLADWQGIFAMVKTYEAYVAPKAP